MERADVNLSMLRLTGIAGIVAAVVWMAGDALLLGGRADPEDFPILEEYADSQIMDAGAVMLPLSTGRLAAGALAGALSVPLYLAGTWHLYLGIRPAGRWLSVPPFVLLFYGFSLSAFAHGSFFYIGEILKTMSEVEPPAQRALLDLATRSTNVLFIDYVVTAVLALIGFVWFTVAVATGNTRYPRWVAIANPVVLIVVGSVSDRVMPEPLATLLAGAGISIGLLLFFGLSTGLLWNGGRLKVGAG